MKRRGFTLVELLAVVAIMAVLYALALPNMRAMVERQRLRMAVFDLLGAVQLARTQAITRGRRVLLVPNEQQGLDWSSGWTLFVDRDGDRRPGPGEEQIAVHGPLPKGIGVESAFSSPHHPDYIAYNGSGRSCTDTSATGARWGSLTLRQGGHVRQIRINMLGRARACDPQRDSSCEGGDDAS